MAQRSFSRGEVCFVRSYIAALLLLGWGWSTSGAELKRSFHQMVNRQGVVEILRKGANVWITAPTNATVNAGDAVRTGPSSRAAILLANDSVITLDQLATVRFPEPSSPRKRFLVNLLKGAAYFFHRERPVETDFETPLVSGAIRGTEFNLAVAENGRTVLTLIDGEVELNNPQGKLALQSGQQAVVEPGAPPVRSAAIGVVNIVQWNLYYPAVLGPAEIVFEAEQRDALANSLSAYKSGDLLKALAAYPAGRQPGTDPERVYLAQLQLAVGQVSTAEQLLDAIPKANADSSELAHALRLVIAAVKLIPARTNATVRSASALLGRSYYNQSARELELALNDARRAVEKSRDFGFAWARVSELEFSFGHTRAAMAAINEALRLSPSNAQAWTVHGFLLAGQGNYKGALASFDRAIEIDSALGNAWLGRGLCRIRAGQTVSGRDDLLVAAALEPNRAVLHSYLGKAFSETWDDTRAGKEFDLAKRLDPQDPTAWLYSALLNQQRNRINEAIEDLERSVEVNDNRQVYRSRMLLDEDRSVRGANLASVYLDAGMEARSFQEAAKSANADYANFSSHLFLANSYNALRDPKQINLRYETPWLSEFLLANLLAPVQAGTLSPSVSQQEYGRLFERNRFGFAGVTEYQSSGDWMQGAVQYGIYDNFAYSADVFYRSENGQRPNNDLDQLSVSLQLKDQLGPSDSVYLQGVYYRASGGDLRQYYDQNSANPGLRTKETQKPLLIAGWHHEWTRESHTLFLVGRFQDTLTLTNSTQPIISQQLGTNGFDQFVVPLDYRSELEMYTAELQQIWQHDPFKLIAGGRLQYGEFDTGNQLPDFFVIPPTQTNFSTTFNRASVYGYGHWQPIDSILLIGGVTYDWLKLPTNFRNPPVSGDESETSRVSPKAGIIWTPWKDTAIRGAYTRSVGGVSFDQSFQLEPSQIAGFNQTYRSLIPESVVGALAGQSFETMGVALDQKFATRTYVGISAELLKSHVTQEVGNFDFVFPPPSPPFSGVPSNTREQLRFQEKSLLVTVNQLVSEEWSFGAQYRLRHADLDQAFPDVTSIAPFSSFVAATHPKATLHQLNLFGMFNHPSGFFSQFQSVWTAQSNSGYTPDQPGDDFWQFNAFVGYRFPKRMVEISAGVLNLTDRDYKLNPLTLYTELPRERTAVFTLKVNF